jgi:hypothetical protein
MGYNRRPNLTVDYETDLAMTTPQLQKKVGRRVENTTATAPLTPSELESADYNS